MPTLRFNEDDDVLIVFIPHDKYNYYNEMNKMRKNLQSCDIKLIAKNGDAIWAHKELLSMSSDYFDAMFNRGFIEASQNEVQMHEIESHVLQILVNFIYTFELTITGAYCQEILTGICYLQLNVLALNECVNFIKEKINPSNCLGWMELADTYDLCDLYSFCLNFVFKQYNDVVKNEEFLMISFNRLLKLVRSQQICFSDEIVHKSIIKWINCDIEDRQKHFSTLIRDLHLPFINRFFTHW